MFLLLAGLAAAGVGPHADFEAAVLDGSIALPVRAPVRRAPPPPTPGPTVKVYGYQAYWDDDLNAVQWDDLTHIALFSAGATSTGGLTDTSRWDEAATAVAMAAPYGVRVHLCVTNFDYDSLLTLLGSATYRQNLIDELVSWQQTTGAHGVNIDFEGLPSSRKTEMVTFVRDLEAAVGEVALATPAVDWSGAWDYSELSQHADLFIMGYGYHWGGSSEAGPTDPLYAGSGTVWTSPWSLTWSVDDYRSAGADPSRIILGLPLYGYSYPTANNNVPTGSLGTGTAVFMAGAVADAAVYGEQYEATSHSPYTYDGSNQIWYPSVDSVLERIDWVLADGIGGFGFWALHYDDDDAVLWGGIHERTADTTGTDPGTGTGTGTGTGGASDALVADAGLPFLAYVGDTVVLSGEGSTGPAGAVLSYVWTQTSGPPVELTDANTANPSFVVEQGGVHRFELVVTDGSDVSAPAVSEVVAIELERSACGCHTGGPAVPVFWLPIVLWIRRRAAS